MPFTANFSRKTMETRFPFAETERDWVISINDPIDPVPNFAQTFERVEPFFFHDMEEKAPFGYVIRSSRGWEQRDWVLFEEADAARMAQIIREARDKEKNVWVHCFAGICRSGAVVEVLSMLGWTLVDEFSPQRTPNMRVKDLLRWQFPELTHSWES